MRRSSQRYRLMLLCFLKFREFGLIIFCDRIIADTTCNLASSDALAARTNDSLNFAHHALNVEFKLLKPFAKINQLLME